MIAETILHINVRHLVKDRYLRGEVEMGMFPYDRDLRFSTGIVHCADESSTPPLPFRSMLSNLPEYHRHISREIQSFGRPISMTEFLVVGL